jgi:hypothetical protein
VVRRRAGTATATATATATVSLWSTQEVMGHITAFLADKLHS